MKLLLSFFLLFSTMFLAAEEPDIRLVPLKRTCFREGDRFFSAGTGIYGLMNPVAGNSPILSDFKNAGLPPLFGRFEMAMSDHIGLGGTMFLHFPAYKWNKSIEVYDNETWTYVPVVYHEKYSGMSLGLLARVGFHFGSTKKSDPYIGLGMGYELYMMKQSSDDPLVSDRIPDRPLPFSAELVFGFRHYVGDDLAVYVEAGYGKMLLNFGLTFGLGN